MNRYILGYGLLILTAGLVHMLWESSHINLYGGYEHIAPLPYIIWYATAGDIMYTLLMCVGYGCMKKRALWFISPTKQDLAYITLCGLCVALFVEYKALIFEKWYYLPSMPTVPFLNVGISPLLQMAILTPLSVYITAYYFGKSRRSRAS